MPKIKAIVIALALVCSGILVTVPAAAGDFEPLGTTNPRVVLAELFTDASNIECPEAHQAMQLLAGEYGRNEVVILAWHSGDNLAFLGGQDRINWASIDDYPTAVFDGITANVGGGPTSEDVKIRYNSHIEQRMDVPSPLKMTVEWEFDTQTGEGMVWTNITAVETINFVDLRLHTVVFEDQVGPYNGGNGETMHDFVAREILETQGAAGAPISIDKDETKRFSYTIDTGYAEDLDQVGVMAFVQSHGSSKEVLQAAYVGVPVLPNQPPVLSEAKLDTSLGNTEDDDVTFKVFYKDTDDARNNGPTEAKVSYKDATSGVTEMDLVPEDEYGNWFDGRYLIYTTTLEPGAYTFKFSASDGKDDAVGDTDWSTTPVNIMPRNKLPDLKDASYSPGSGDTTTTFRFEVMYRDLDDVKPETSIIMIDGREYTMKTDSLGPWNNWVYYYYETTLSASLHKYYFMFSDGMDDVRYPSENAVPNWITGPTVAAPNDIPTLTTPHHSPEDGQRTTDFEFVIIYTDGENDPPLMSRIYIDNHPCLMITDSVTFDEGAMFVYKTKLDLGEHRYYFWFNDGVNDVRYPKTDMLDGPTVVNLDPEAIVEYPSEGDVFEPGEIVMFSAAYSRDPEGDILRFSWSSGIDGPLSNDMNFDAHLSEGMHDITLEVSDDFGGTDTVTFKITVKGEYGHPYFEGYSVFVDGKEIVEPGNPVTGNLVVFIVTINNDGQIPVHNQLVEFVVDGVVIGTPTVSVEVDGPIKKDFEWTAEPGSHIVKFVMGEETLEFVQKVGDNDPPYSDPDARNEKGAPIVNPKTGQVIAFAANADDPDDDPMTYFWDFGDGVTSYEENPTHTYDKPGDYVITVAATDSHGATTTKTFEMQVTKPPPDTPGFGALVAASAMIVALLGAAMARRRR